MSCAVLSGLVTSHIGYAERAIKMYSRIAKMRVDGHMDEVLMLGGYWAEIWSAAAGGAAAGQGVGGHYRTTAACLLVASWLLVEPMADWLQRTLRTCPIRLRLVCICCCCMHPHQGGHKASDGAAAGLDMSSMTRTAVQLLRKHPSKASRVYLRSKLPRCACSEDATVDRTRDNSTAKHSLSL